MSLLEVQPFTPGLINRLCETNPDIFTPPMVALLYNQYIQEQILEGDTPGLLKNIEGTDLLLFIPIYTKLQLQLIRSELEAEFQIEVPKTEIVEKPQIISIIPHPDADNVVFTMEQIRIWRSEYSLTPGQRTDQPPTFRDIFGFEP